MNTRVFARQDGVTFGGLLIILVIIGFLALIAMRLFPVYMESFGVKSSLESVVKEVEKESHTPIEIREKILKRLDINDVDDVTKEDIVIKREGFFYSITIDYEVRVPFIKNIDFIVKFENHAQVPAR